MLYFINIIHITYALTMSKQPENHLETNIKQQALKKLNQEICKNIENVKELCKYTTLNELLKIMWYVHVCRIYSNYTNEIIGSVEKNNPDLVKIYCFRLEDTFKYIISSMVKFGCKNKADYTVNNLEISGQDLIGYLIKEVNIINSKQEAISLIDLFDIEFYQEKSGIIKINFDSLNSNSQKNIFSEYFRRLAQDNFKAYQAQKSYHDFLNKFKNEYIQYSDLFEEVFKIPLENFVEFIQYIGLIFDF